MSQTTAPLDAPSPALAVAATPRQVTTALVADPALMNAVLSGITTLVANKSALGSKTVWVALLSSIIIPLAAHFGLPVDQAVAASAATVIMGAAMIVMRFFTKGAVTSMLPQSKGPTP